MNMFKRILVILVFSIMCTSVYGTTFIMRDGVLYTGDVDLADYEIYNPLSGDGDFEEYGVYVHTRVVEGGVTSYTWTAISGQPPLTTDYRLRSDPEGVTHTFHYMADTEQMYIVPGGITRVVVKLWGAAGSGYGVGGNGGFTVVGFDVIPGDILTLRVPRGSTPGRGGEGGEGGWPGGGDGMPVRTDRFVGGGGGYAAVYHGSELMAVAGGGGGAGYNNWGGGHGGGVRGRDGVGTAPAAGAVDLRAKGGSQTEAGNEGTPGAGGFLQGGHATFNDTGGGGGGYYGGGSAQMIRGTGGGGSGYISPLCEWGYTTVAQNWGDANYASGIGVNGGRSGPGGNGMIVIIHDLP